MKKINIEGREVEIFHAAHRNAGFGHKRIFVELFYEDEYRTFSDVTNDMPGFDAAMCTEDDDEQNFSLYSLIAAKMEDEIIEWMDEVDNLLK